MMEEEEGGKRVSCWLKELPLGYMPKINQFK